MKSEKMKNAVYSQVIQVLAQQLADMGYDDGYAVRNFISDALYIARRDAPDLEGDDPPLVLELWLDYLKDELSRLDIRLNDWRTDEQIIVNLESERESLKQELADLESEKILESDTNNVKISLNFKELLDAVGYIDEMEGIADGLYSLLENAIKDQRGSVDDATLNLMLKGIEEERAKHH